jgi:hypothetical protein
MGETRKDCARISRALREARRTAFVPVLAAIIPTEVPFLTQASLGDAF